jgi:hypothetical protein
MPAADMANAILSGNLTFVPPNAAAQQASQYIGWLGLSSMATYGLCCGRTATTRTSARNSPGSTRTSAHSAIAASRLNDSCGEQRTVEVSVSGLSRSSTVRVQPLTASPAWLARGQRLEPKAC